ncbi:MAG: UvrD-helicase domain-containing protein [Candidatus Borkfalkiaceae bacterium]|nr:UvrD-helicase domain-containing protein [Clostridia bacterium]MDY6223145.1 UvrD-helicase domain-containing protein [Christensenellaceae bacterium]
MGKNNFTGEQTAALEAKGRTIVSASAGSGKTTVMIEKIVRLILNGADVSQILALTFTKKAAQQMKDKLKSALVNAINDESTPEEELPRLKSQLAAAQNAEFSTIHSFCSNLIRTHFYAAGTGGDFTVIASDDVTGKELKARALSSLFEKAYDSADPDFMLLLSVFFRKKKDDTLKNAIVSAYDSLRETYNYREFLQRGTEYTEEKFNGVCEELLRNFKKKCRYYRLRAEEEKVYFEKINAGENARQSIDNATALIAAFTDFENTPDYFSLKDVPKETYKQKQRKSKNLPPDFEEHTGALAECKEAFNALHERAEAVPARQNALEDYFAAGKIAAALGKYVLLFEEEYEAEKRERNVLDYNDLEHIALSLLSDEAVRGEIREKYPYVFVDEYQDVNPVQEELLSAVSGNNVFLVGDVKQAIYGFRGSRSEYFAKKRKTFANEEGAHSLSMNCNFRSAPAILNAVNEIFSAAMTGETSFSDYRTEGVMQSGAPRYKTDGRVRFHLVNKEKKQKTAASGIYSVFRRSKSVDDEKFKALTGRNETGDEIARIVKEELASTYFDADEGVEKPVRYGDIAVLIRRNRQAVTQGILAAFTFADIPFATSSPVCLDDYPEIRAVTDILSYIDNAEQDVPMCGAMCSPAGNFTAEELAEVRLAYPDEPFFRGACKAYAAERADGLAEKLRAFFNYFAFLRDLAAVTCADEVLTRLFADTGMEAALLARKTGKDCLKRLHYFSSLSLDPQPLSVHEFLAKLRLMKGNTLYAQNAGENVVHVMTMHNSKGLEYPVVIVADVCDPFRGKNDRGEFVTDETLGAATKFYDVQKRVQRETLLRELIFEKKSEQERADELNIFYVALTRAKYALHVVFGKVPPAMNVPYAGCYAEFIPGCAFEKYLVQTSAEEAGGARKAEEFCASFDEVTAQKIYDELTRVYPFTGGENLPVKQSATSLLSQAEAAFSSPTIEGSFFADDLLWDAEREEKEKTGAEKRTERRDRKERTELRRKTGLAYHAFLQYADFSFLRAGESVAAEKAEIERKRLRGAGLISEEYDALLKTETLVKILSNPVFAGVTRAENGGRVLREANFLVALPVKDVYFSDPARYGTIGEETTLFQGAADLLVIEEGRAHIVDYKYSMRDAADLREKYTPQLLLYRKAVAKITGIQEENIRCTLLNLARGYSLEI